MKKPAQSHPRNSENHQEAFLTEPFPLEVSLPEWQLPPESENTGDLTLVSILTLALHSAQNMQRAVDRFFREAPQEEVRRFRPLWEKIEKGKGRQTQKGQVTEEWKWLVSFLLWDTYQRGEQEQALEDLHKWLDVDCAFFLRQWWVIGLIASWHQEGKQKEIRRLFEGRRGKRQQQNIAEVLLRDEQIVVAVEKHLLACNYREALRRTAAELETQRVKPFTEAAIRRVYENTRSPDPLKDASVHYAAQTVLQRYGCSNEEAEQEIAARPEEYKLHPPLSPDLVHQIRRRHVRRHPRRL